MFNFSAILIADVPGLCFRQCNPQPVARITRIQIIRTTSASYSSSEENSVSSASDCICQSANVLRAFSKILRLTIHRLLFRQFRFAVLPKSQIFGNLPR